MIHNATIEVTCDAEHCRESVYIEPDYVYRDRYGGGGHYDTRDSEIEKKLVAEEWVVVDGKHYCPGHAPEENE